MTKETVFKIFNIEDIQDLPNAVTLLLDGEQEKRDATYRQLLEANNNDVSYDWFQAVYQEELAQRGQKKQDFTPNQVSVILSRLTGAAPGVIHEPTAGNGSLLITNWWHRCSSIRYPWLHFPSNHMVDCWELSNRSIPILLLNLSIRGIMGYVYHGDVLTQEIKMRYVLLNRKNDTLAFSEIIKDPSNNMKIYAK